MMETPMPQEMGAGDPPGDNELWLLDHFGWFLHNDPKYDWLVGFPLERCPQGQPGLVVDAALFHERGRVALAKRETRPMPLPTVEVFPTEGMAIGLRIVDTDGPYGGWRDRFISSQPGGPVMFDRGVCQAWELYVPLPARLARLLGSECAVALQDEQGEMLEPPRPESGFHVRVAGRLYALRDILPVLENLAALKAGDRATVVLPAGNGTPPLSVTAIVPPRDLLA